MNKKEIINLIHKYSQIPQLGKAKAIGNQNTNSTINQSSTNSSVSSLWENKNNSKNTNTPTTSNNFVIKIVLESVKQMQTGIHELANAVMDNSSFTKALNDFIASNYISSLDPDKKGIELQSASQNKDKLEIDTYEIDVVMGNLQKIVQEKNLFKLNGIWDVKTDTCLRNIFGLAYSLLQLEGDFRLRNQNYTSKNLNDFYTLLSGYNIKNNVVNLSKEEQDNRANKIYTHLKSIKNLYVSMKYQLQSKPEYRSLMETKKPLDTYTNFNESITLEEETILENPYVTITLEDKDPNSNNVINFIIPLHVFSNKESFMQFMKKYNIKDEETVLKYLNSFVRKINNLRV